MTTLPQTTTSRPVRAVPRMPGVPQPMAGAPGAMGANQFTMNDFLRVLRANWLLITLITFLSLAMGVAVHYYLNREHPRYTAEGLVQIITPTEIEPIEGGSVTRRVFADMQTRQKTEAQQMLSEGPWYRLFENAPPALTATDWYRSFLKPDGQFDLDAALEDARDSFRASPIVETELVSVKFTAANPSDAKEVLTQVVNVYLASQRSDNIAEMQGVRQNLESFKRRFELRLVEVNRRIQNLQSRLGTQGGAQGLANKISLATNEIGQLQTELIRKSSDIEAAIGAFEQLQQQNQAGETPASVESYVSTHPRVDSMESMIESTKMQIALSEAELGAGHRTVTSLQNQLDVLEQNLADKKAELRVQGFNLFMAQSSSARADAERIRDQLQQQIQAATARLTELSNDYAEYLALEDERKYLDERVNQVNDQVEVVMTRIESQQRSAVTVAWAGNIPPFEPKTKSFPKLPMSLGGALLLGLGLSLGIAFLREFTDTSVRSPRDLAKVGQLNMLGMVAHEDDDPQAAGSNLALVISQAPHSMIAEQFRQVRTRLQHGSSLDTTRSIIITSPGPGDGKTVVATNLAAGLALNGRKILLVDANFRRPELHKVFGVDNDRGFGNVLSSQATVDQAAHKTSVPNLDVLTTGPRPANSTELLESQLLSDFIDRSLEEYDHVIFDTGPLLLVSETVALAPRVDGVISVVRARANSRGVVQRMRDAMRQLKADHLGIVLNAVRTQGGGYYGRNIKNYYAYQNGSN